MNHKSKAWMLPAAGSLLLAAAAVNAAPPPPPLERESLEATNRLTGSIRFGLNISGKFLNPGGSLNPRAVAGNGQRTAKGDRYNYNDGYVLKDSSGNAGSQTWYWGYNHPSQVNATAPNSVDFHSATAPSLPGESSGDDSPYIGCEIAYAYQLGVKEEWHNLRYGLEGAVNFMPIDFTSGGTYNTSVNQRTDTYGYTAGTTPPGAPYQGGYSGPGFVLNVPPSSSTTAIPGAKVTAHQQFDSTLWGFRLGPYLESPLTKKLSLHVSGGLAAGILDASANWKETVTLPNAGGSIVSQGGGSDTDVLWGYYLGADLVYRFSKQWGLDVGVQYQNLGTYSHDFGGRTAELDLSRSLFIQAGISYSF